MPRSSRVAVLGVAFVLFAHDVRAGENTMSEPVIEENITDIDGRESPTIEFDLTPSVLRAQHTRAGLWKTGLEMEWRPVDRLGVGAELDTAGALDDWRPVRPFVVVPRGALSYVLLRDFDHEFFLQAEVAGRYNGGPPLALVDPTETALPFQAGLRSAQKLGPIDARLAVLGEAGDAYAHAPIHASVAALYTIIGESARGAFGAEVLADWGRRAPYMLAPQGQFLARVFGKPVRFEVAVPVTVGATGADAAYGLAFRFVVEPEE